MPAMTTDADWLRARPEILKLVRRLLLRHLWGGSNFGEEEFLQEALPLLRAEIREDVIRELAGADVYHPDPDAVRMLAAAHVQGYERAREDAARVVEDNAVGYSASSESGYYFRPRKHGDVNGKPYADLIRERCKP